MSLLLQAIFRLYTVKKLFRVYCVTLLNREDVHTLKINIEICNFLSGFKIPIGEKCNYIINQIPFTEVYEFSAIHIIKATDNTTLPNITEEIFG